MRRRTPGLATMLLTLLIALLSLSNPATAEPSLPSSPSITPATLPPDASPDATESQPSPTPAESDFSVPGQLDPSNPSDPSTVPIEPDTAPEPLTPLGSAKTPSDCPVVQAFGLRGTRHNPTDTAATDHILQSFFDQLTIQIPHVQTTAINYPLVSVDLTQLRRSYTFNYALAVGLGSLQLRVNLHRFWSLCPHTYVILAGYGPGAQAVGNLAEDLAPWQQRHIAAIILLGDPRFDPKTTAINIRQTGYSSQFAGSYQLVNKRLRHIPPNLRPDTRSFCLKGDPVCNFNPDTTGCAGPVNCNHLKYAATGWTKHAATWAATHWRELPPLN